MAQVLARFDAGVPAVVARTGTGASKGRVLLWASTLDKSWTDLPVKPVFLPFVHQAARFLSAYKDAQPWLTVGQVLDPSVAAAPKGPSTPRVLLSPSGKRLPLEDEGTDVLELTEQGFYEVRAATGEGDLAVVASNVDPTEADLTPMDPREIVAAATGGPADGESESTPGVPLTPEAREKNQRLWWYLLCAGIVLLGLDTVMSNRMAKA
jgi:hypothetical protein